jgi:hypothetical protein
MANTETVPGKTPVVDNAMFKLFVQAAVPALLGVLITLAASINSAQKEQGNAISEMTGKLGVLVEQNTNFGIRLNKVEERVDANGRSIGEITGRVRVLEELRRR